MMTTFLSLLSVETIDSNTCVIISSENEKIIFDVGEGTQRLCVEHKFRLSKISKIFITRLSPNTICGIPGTCLTVADIGKNSLEIIGPVGLQSFWNSTKSFMSRQALNVRIFEIIGSTRFSCENLKVTGIPFDVKSKLLCYLCETNRHLGKFNVDKARKLNVPLGPLYAQLKSGKTITLSDGSVVTPEQVLEESEQARYCVIIPNLVDMVNEVDIFSNLSLMFSEFKSNGKDLPERKVFDCMVHLSPKWIFETESYIAWKATFGDSTIHFMCGENSNFLNHSSFISATILNNKLHGVCSNFFTEMNLTVNLSCLENDCNAHVNDIVGIPLTNYTLWPSSRRGIEYNYPSLIEVSESVQSFLNILDCDTSFRRIQNISEHCDEYIDRQNNRMHDKFLIVPDFRIYFLGTGCAVPSKYRNVSGILFCTQKTDLNCEITESMMLLDCGEGTWHQLMRVSCNNVINTHTKVSHPDHPTNSSLSDAQARIFLISTQLKLIWISHPHADHHLGTISVILNRYTTLQKFTLLTGGVSDDINPLLVIAPASVLLFLNSFCEILPEMRKMFVPLDCLCFDPDYAKQPREFSKIDENSTNDVENRNSLFAASVLDDIGVIELTNIRVSHCNQSYGVVIKIGDKQLINESGSACGDELVMLPAAKRVKATSDFVKVVYSGDTRPCERLIQVGKDADLLIHEATFDDSRATEALNKRHSTISEAMEVAKQMNAFRTILTHFSQRYSYSPPFYSSHKPFLNEPSHADSHVPIYAYDFMSISFKDLLWANKLTQYISKIFPSGKEEEDINAETSLNDSSQMCSNCSIENNNKTKKSCSTCRT